MCIDFNTLDALENDGVDKMRNGQDLSVVFLQQ